MLMAKLVISSVALLYKYVCWPRFLMGLRSWAPGARHFVYLSYMIFVCLTVYALAGSGDAAELRQGSAFIETELSAMVSCQR